MVFSKKIWGTLVQVQGKLHLRLKKIDQGNQPNKGSVC